MQASSQVRGAAREEERERDVSEARGSGMTAVPDGAGYARELREHWRYWLGAACGLSVGIATQSYSNNLFAPHMIAEFGWSRATFALQGTLSVAMFFIVPVIGRLTDLFGSRTIASIGVVGLPLAYLAFSLQDGSMPVFFALSIFKMLIGATTASIVYSRVVALQFTVARGLALAICASAPAAFMIAFVPVLGLLIEEHGWRNGYRVLAIVALVIGLFAVAIIPGGGRREADAETQRAPVRRTAKGDYGTIFRDRTFWIVMAGMFLCNAPNVLVASQFGLLLVEQKISVATVPWFISLYGASVVVGRFACGIALDRFAPYRVAALSMAMPAIGFILMAAEINDMRLVACAVVFIGLAQGAEGDLVAYLAAHYFSRALYGSVAGLISAGLALSSALGAAMLSGVLHLADSFVPFLQIMACTTLLGAGLFLLLRGRRKGLAFHGSPLEPDGSLA